MDPQDEIDQLRARKQECIQENREWNELDDRLEKERNEFHEQYKSYAREVIKMEEDPNFDYEDPTYRELCAKAIQSSSAFRIASHNLCVHREESYYVQPYHRVCKRLKELESISTKKKMRIAELKKELEELEED